MKNRISSPRVTCFEPLEDRRMFAAGGALDNLFSSDGKATVAFSAEGVGTARDVAVQADGKTVVVGEVKFRTVTRIGVIRFNANGSLDNTFGPAANGRVSTFSGSSGDDRGEAVAIQPDGKIIVVGTTRVVRSFASDRDEMFVMRLLPDGTKDKSFAGDGTLQILIKESSKAHDVVIQRDGKIVVAGEDTNGIGSGNSDFAVARINRDGTLDKTFAGSGKRTIPMGEFEEARAVAIDNSGTAASNPNFGKIILAGDIGGGDVGRQYAMARLNTDGGLDNSFDGNGVLSDRFTGSSRAFARGLLVQPNGRYIVVGITSTEEKPTVFGAALARRHTDGSIDKSFGGRQTGSTSIGFDGSSGANSVVESSTGGLVVAGTSNGRFALASFSAEGVRDRTFGSNGTVTTSFGADGTAGSVAMAKTSGGKVVVAGGSALKTARYFDFTPVSVSLKGVNSQMTEGRNDSAVFTVTRSRALPVPTRVFLSVEGTAQKPGLSLRPEVGSGDYALSGMRLALAFNDSSFVDIPAGQTSATITLTPRDDSSLEPAETAIFRVLKNDAYDLAAPSTFSAIMADNDQVHVNFQTAGAAPAGYVADTGAIFGARGNGLSYGWDADNSINARLRKNKGSPDARYDTFNHMQKPGASRSWEIAVPNGLYTVRLVAGDPSNTDSVHRMNLEGRLALSGTPTGDTRWFRSTTNVSVTDGKLTLTNATGAVNNKIAFIDIKGAAFGAPVGPVVQNVPVRLVGPTTASLWTKLPSGLFSDNQIDEALWV